MIKKQHTTKDEKRNLIIINVIMSLFIVLCIGGIIEMVRESSMILSAQNNISTLYEQYTDYIESCHSLYKGSDYLTDQARLYSETESITHVNNYFKEYGSMKQRDSSNADAKDPFGIKTMLADAYRVSEELSQTEFRSMYIIMSANGFEKSDMPNDMIRNVTLTEADLAALSDSPENAKAYAREILKDDEYERQRNFILGKSDDALEKVITFEETELEELIRSQTHNINLQTVFVSVFIFLEIALALLVIFHSIRQFRRERQVEEITAESKELHEQLHTFENIAKIDSLTGLHTAYYYYEVIEQVKQYPDEPFSLIMCDINNLKQTNDAYGHAVGNNYILNFSKVIRRVFDKDIVCRYGGDEFIVVLRGKDYDNRDSLIKKLREEAALAEKIDGIENGYVSFSFGSATYRPEGDMQIDEVIELADMRMYSEKRKYKATKNQ